MILPMSSWLPKKNQSELVLWDSVRFASRPMVAPPCSNSPKPPLDRSSL